MQSQEKHLRNRQHLHVISLLSGERHEDVTVLSAHARVFVSDGQTEADLWTGMNVRRASNTDWGGWSEPLNSSRFEQLQIFPKHCLNLEVFHSVSVTPTTSQPTEEPAERGRCLRSAREWWIDRSLQPRRAAALVNLLFINRWSCSWQAVWISAFWGVLPSTQLSFCRQRSINTLIYIWFGSWIPKIPPEKTNSTFWALKKEWRWFSHLKLHKRVFGKGLVNMNIMYVSRAPLNHICSF